MFFRVHPCLPTKRRSLLALVLSLVLASYALAEGLSLSDGVLDWVEARYGSGARERVVALRELLSSNTTVDESAKLARVNDFFNQIPFDSDWDLWDKEDYWATPIEVLGVHGADCEDFAIAKYFSLRELGVPAQRLRITYVKAIELNQAHMVLAYYPQPEAEPLILDNLIPAIRPAGERGDLVPVYGFNGESLWLAANKGQGSKVGGSSRIKRWTDLRAKMAGELAR